MMRDDAAPIRQLVAYQLYQSAWVCHVDYTFRNILMDVASRITKLSVGLDNEQVRLSNDWKAHVFKKTIRGLGAHVP
jgi:hypothetical protein